MTGNDFEFHLYAAFIYTDCIFAFMYEHHKNVTRGLYQRIRSKELSFGSVYDFDQQDTRCSKSIMSVFMQMTFDVYYVANSQKYKYGNKLLIESNEITHYYGKLISEI